MNRSLLLSLLALCLLFPLAACGPTDELYDFDGDGSLDTEDCAPSDPAIYPGADDPYGDELDRDCDGGDGFDSDRDGYPANEDLEPEYESLYDCDDTRATIHPGASDNVGDQVDSNCDGHDGTDNDGDGYASLNSEGDDCDDTQEDIHPGADDPYDDDVDSNCDGGDGIDNDGDGYPANEELLGSEFYDCNDANAAVHPGAEEVPDDGIDNDCDGAELVDGDSDGHYDGFDDCDDTDPSIFLGAPELPDGIDNDCDTLVDEGTELADDDGDGYCEGWDLNNDGSLDCSGVAEPGDCDDSNTLLTPADVDGDLVSSCAGDCDDSNSLRSPVLPELCDGLDNDCDLALPTDEQDVDSDGYMPCTGDCNDLVDTTYLGAAESCNGVDDDCDSSTDEDFDGDGDGVTSCGEDGLPGTPDDDCDDSNAAVSPALTEACDGLDNDCDLLVPSNEDDLDLDGFMVCEADCDDADPLLTPADGDGDGASSCAGDCDDNDTALNLLDVDGDGATSCDGDCDDSDAANYPANTEVCDGQDNDCDVATSAAGGEDDVDGDSDPSCSDCDDDDPDYNSFDDDGDGFSPCGADGIAGTSDDDCDDSDYWMNPSVTDFAGDGIDQNCDEADGFDGDGDSYASFASLGTDCDDTNAAVNPGATELCDGLDTDCNPATDETEDGDGDGYSLLCDGDCNDVNDTAYPGGTEVCDLADNDCDGSVDEGFGTDDDGDGWLVCQGDCDDTDPAFYPGQWDSPGDGLDQDCDGTVDSTGLSAVPISFLGVDSQHYRESGFAVASAGDVDGDGLDDLIIGAPGAEPGGQGVVTSGNAYLMYGGTIWGPGMFPLGFADATFVGNNSVGTGLGFSVAGAGDLNGDGFDDIALGAPWAQYDNNWNPGYVYVFFGSSTGPRGTLGANFSADLAFVGEATNEYGDDAGYSVSSAGDVDGDGLADLLIGAPYNTDGGTQAGKTYLFFGSSIAAGGTFNLSEADATFVGGQQGERQGTSVSSGGDIDGDGLDDLLIGSPESGGGMNWAGKTYLFFGSTVANGGDFAAMAADATFLGDTSDQSGWSVASAGDVDGDGLDDLLIGAPGDIALGGPAAPGGKTCLFFGSSLTLGGTFSLSQADISFLGVYGVAVHSGGSVASAGDVDGDGLDDVLIGQGWGCLGGLSSYPGKAYLFLGQSLSSGTTLDLSESDFVFVGEVGWDKAGCSVAGAGDVDGDGLDDLLIGAPWNEEGGFNAGKTYLLLSPY